MAGVSPSYRLFVDESGDHSSSHPVDIGKRYLGTIGVAFNVDNYRQFRERLEAFKQKHLPYDPAHPPVLHRVEIVQAKGIFKVLQDAARRAAFDNDLLGLIKATPFTAFAVVVDKVEHAPKLYRLLKHPYHWTVLALLERYCGWLRYFNRRGDVLAESRGKAEDQAFREAYAHFCEHGEQYLSREDVEATLTSREAKLAKKAANVAGLQLADLLAHPLTRDVLVAYGRIANRGGPFADQIAAISEMKYNQRYDTGRINGYGRKIIA